MFADAEQQQQDLVKLKADLQAEMARQSDAFSASQKDWTARCNELDRREEAVQQEQASLSRAVAQAEAGGNLCEIACLCKRFSVIQSALALMTYILTMMLLICVAQAEAGGCISR